jgi:predicted metal-dependent hydrolase
MSVAMLQYAVRISPKARNVRLKMTVQHGLEVVVPRGFNQTRIPALLQRKKRWIENTHQRLEEHRKFFQPEPPGKLPDHISLPAVGEDWRVEYREAKARWAGVRRVSNDRLVVTGNIEDERECKLALRRWLARRCHDSLVTWLREISKDTGLPFGRAMVKMQKTRWASCSRHKTISLNLKLLFLPPSLVRYVFIHELSHTVHMNHSRKYWRFLMAKEPNCMALDKQLRTAWRLVPAWV